MSKMTGRHYEIPVVFSLVWPKIPLLPKTYNLSRIQLVKSHHLIGTRLHVTRRNLHLGQEHKNDNRRQSVDQSQGHVLQRGCRSRHLSLNTMKEWTEESMAVVTLSLHDLIPVRDHFHVENLRIGRLSEVFLPINGHRSPARKIFRDHAVGPPADPVANRDPEEDLWALRG